MTMRILSFAYCPQTVTYLFLGTFHCTILNNRQNFIEYDVLIINLMSRRLLVLLLCLTLAFPGTIARLQTAHTVIENPDHHINTSPLDAVAISSDGTLIVSGGRDNIVRLWDAATGDLRGQMLGHTAWVTRVAISSDGRTIVSGSQDTTVRLWDTKTFALRATLAHHNRSVTGVAFSPDGRLLATTGLDGIIWIGETANGHVLARLNNFNNAVWSVAFSADGRRLATGSEDGTIWLWGLYDNSVTRLEGHAGAVTALTFNADGTRLISSSWDRTARVWDVSQSPPLPGNTLLTLNGHYGPVTGAGFSARGLITSSLDGTVRLWDAASGQLTTTLQGSTSMIGSTALSADGTWAVTAGIDGVIESWNITARIPETVAVVPTIPPAPQPTRSLPVFTPQPLPTHIPRPTAQPQTDSPAPIPTAAPSSGGTTLSMPTVNVFAGITTFPLNGYSWTIDPWEKRVGHLQGTAWFDSIGNVVLGGHSTYPNGKPGIFAGLYQLNIGDPVIINVDSIEHRYIVTDKFTVHYDDLTVAYPSSDNKLTLITCDIPSFDAKTQFYSERLVVIARPG